MNLILSRAAFVAAILAPASAHAEAAADDTIVVTASRSGDPIRIDQIGGSVTVLDARALESRQVRNVYDVLRDVPGVAVSHINGLTQLRLRGSEGNHVLVLVDGIEVSDPYQGEFDFSTLIADDSARIEVLRGQQSALYGSDAIGGVVHYITSTGAEAPGIRLRAEGGSFGTINGAARVAGVTGNLDYALSATANTTDGTPTARGGIRDVGIDSYAVSLKSTWSPSEIFRLTAVARYSYTDGEFNNTDYVNAPTFGLTIDSPGSYFHNKALYGLVKGELDLLDGRWTHAITAQIADTERDGFDFDAPSFGDKGRRYKGSYETAFRFGTDSVKHRLTFAADVERERYRNTDPFGFAFPGWRHTDNIGLVGAYDVTVDDRLALGASIRRDENDRFADATTWRAQGSYRFDSGTRIRAAGGSGIKNPGFYDLYGFNDGVYTGNPNLKPEKSRGWEMGVEQGFGGNKALIGVTYFRNRLKDEIFITFPAPDFLATPDNRDNRSKQQGVEMFIELRPVPQLTIDANYTWLKATEAGLKEVRRPNHVGSLNVTYGAPDDRFTTTLTVRYNGRQTDLAFTDPSFIPDRVSLQEYVLVNLAADFKLNDHLSLFGRVENLFDEKYEELFSFRTQGRAAYAGVSARF